MKYAPSLPPVAGLKDRWNTVSVVGSVEPIRKRVLPPQAVQRRDARPDYVSDAAQEGERRHIEVDRRKYGRRVRQESILIELRSGKDRRQHAQRDTDALSHIDEEA